MKTKLLKSMRVLLVAAGLCAGANAWALNTVSDGTTVSPLRYVKYEVTLAQGQGRAAFIAGGSYANNANGGNADAKGWYINTDGRYFTLTLGKALKVGDVITINCATAYSGGENGIGLYGITGDRTGYSLADKDVYIKYPSGASTEVNYDLSYTVQEDDGLAGATVFSVGLGMNANRRTYFRSFKVTTADASEAVIGNQLTDSKTWTFESYSSTTYTANTVLDDLFVGASSDAIARLDESSLTYEGTKYTNALVLEKHDLGNINGESDVTVKVGGVLFRLPAGRGKVTIIQNTPGSGGYVYYNFIKPIGSSRSRNSTYTGKSGAITFTYESSDFRDVYFYSAGPTVYIYAIKVELYPDAKGTLSTQGYSTFSHNVPFDLSTLEGATAYKAQASGDKIVMTKVTEGLVPAGTGLFLAGSPNANFSISSTTGITTALENNSLIGTMSETNVAKEDGFDKYVLGADGESVSFFLIGETPATVPANKAYLKVTANPSISRKLVISFGGEATGINSFDNETLTTDDVYNLSGQRVAQPAKGLYIKNGKKYINK